jgi:hypothetical protein
MDAKKLNSEYKIKSKLIPLLNEDTNLSENIDLLLSHFDEQFGHETKSSSLNYAANHFKDGGRAKEYSKIIADKWNMPEDNIIYEINFVRFHVKVLMIKNLYGADKIVEKEKEEVSVIRKLVDEIEAGSIDTLEITFKATGKGVSNNVRLESDAIVTKLFECLKSLPKEEIKTRSKGRPKGEKPETYTLKECAKEIKKKYSPQIIVKNELCEFIGYIFVAAGIFMDENEFYDQDNGYQKYRDYLIQKIKALL